MSKSEAEPFSAASVERRLIRIPLIVTGTVGIVATLVCLFVASTPGLLGGLVGTVVVLAFFGLGQIFVARALRNNPALAMNMAMLVYLVQIVALFILLIVLKQATFFSPKAFAATIFAGVIAWTVSAITVMSRARVLYVEPDSNNTSTSEKHGGGSG